MCSDAHSITLSVMTNKLRFDFKMYGFTFYDDDLW